MSSQPLLVCHAGGCTKSYQMREEPDPTDTESVTDNALVFGVLFEMLMSNQ